MECLASHIRLVAFTKWTQSALSSLSSCLQRNWGQMRKIGFYGILELPVLKMDEKKTKIKIMKERTLFEKLKNKSFSNWMHKSLIFPKEIFSVFIRRSLQGRGSFFIIFANLQICKSAPPPQPSSSQQINAIPFFLLTLPFHASFFWGFCGRKPRTLFFIL